MLHTFLITLYEVFVPIALPLVAGAALARFRSMETRPLTTLALYVLSPAIIYHTLANASISYADVRDSILFSLSNLLVLWLLAISASRLLRLDRSEQAGLTLVVAFTNSVNYGLPLVLLAFGQLGLDKASVYVVTQMIIVNTIGILFAARSHFNWKQAGLSVLRLPSIYAALAAMLVRGAGWSLPSALQEGISLIAAAYSPVVLVILGAQMLHVYRAPRAEQMDRAFWAGMGIRLLISPAAAFAILFLLNVEDTLFRVLLILASMPTAVNAVLLAEQFDASPRLVSRCILWTTLLSFILLPLFISWLA